ncbi:MAG TPA: ABC transporter permease [Anaerolineales bacterium]|nr:ABC transporter permease [Anaerolineales bacterium]
MTGLSVSLHLATRELWRNRGRFLLFSMVIALITVLVLFIAALAEGLADANRQYLSKLDAQLMVLGDRADGILTASRIGRSRMAAVERVEGVAAAGAIGFSTANVIDPLPKTGSPLRVSLVGVEPGKPGEPPAIQGRGLSTIQAGEVVLDRAVLNQLQIAVGDTLTIQTTQGTQDQTYTLRVVGVSDNQAYLFQPTLFVPMFTWDRVRPKGEGESASSELTVGTIAVRIEDATQVEAVRARLLDSVSRVEVQTVKETYENLPGYSAQQSTLTTQSVFTLLIGVLVIGGFFQIQILQKVPQIGVLKAIGAANSTVGTAAVIQIVLVTAIGVALGSALTLGLSLGMPASVPVAFTGAGVATAIAALLLIGPIGGSVSVRYAIQIEPLRALGL